MSDLEVTQNMWFWLCNYLLSASTMWKSSPIPTHPADSGMFWCSSTEAQFCLWWQAEEPIAIQGKPGTGAVLAWDCMWTLEMRNPGEWTACNFHESVLF